MTTGSTANLAYALSIAKREDDVISAVGKLTLLLLADDCTGGLGLIPLARLAARIGGGITAEQAYSIAEELAEAGFLNISDMKERQFACALPIATWEEVEDARNHIAPDWRLKKGPGTA
tara:strand:- start:60 stop:416 length:357 start_codon:yes stop_codon:yes gene_type:complete